MEQGYTLKKPKYMKTRKRLGCGGGSGSGNKCGSGQDGQKSRSGSKYRAWFEGGQMPLQRRVPKRGFNNIFKKEFQVVNLSSLEKIGSDEINPDMMKKNGVIRNSDMLIKVLGKGEVTKSLKVHADAFSKSALEKIEKAGGQAIIRKISPKKEG